MHFLEMLPLISAAIKKNNEKYGLKCFSCLELMHTRARCEYNFIKRKILKLEKIGEIKKAENCNISDKYLLHIKKLQKAVFNHNLKNAKLNFYILASRPEKQSIKKSIQNKIAILRAKSIQEKKCWKHQKLKNKINECSAGDK